MRKSTNPNKIYESISTPSTGRNSFDKTHVVTATGKVGHLIPMMVVPVHPKDKIRVGYDVQVRFPALVVPANVRFDAYLHTFYVPYRVLWSGFDEWFTPDGETNYDVPDFQVKTALTAAQQRFMDDFGIPPIADSTAKESLYITAAPFAAYQKIYNDYYRPRPFEDPINIALPDAGGHISDALRDRLLTRRLRSWEHDYFTSMLPEPLVAPDVTLGVGTVVLKANWPNYGDPGFVDASGAYPNANEQSDATPGWVNNNTTLIPNSHFTMYDLSILNQSPRAWDPDGTYEVEGATLNEWRLAMARQRYLEKMGRSGGEYYEVIMALYDQRIPDARLQRAEYITGMKAPVMINPVLATAEGTSTDVGQQYGHAIAIGNGGGKEYECAEHGYVITIFSLIPKPMYKQGIPRHFRAFSREDMLIPDLANIGEQPVYSWELTAYEEPESQISVIGYMPNYTHLKQMQSRVAGEFRSSLDMYTVVKEYDTTLGVPSLDKEFVQVPEDIADHIFAVMSGVSDPLWITLLNAVDHELPLPVYSDPC